MDAVLLCAFKNIIDDHSYSVDEKINILETCIDNGVDINYDNSQVLIQAILRKNLLVITFLINSGIDIQTNNEILIEACSQTDTQILKILLLAGLDPTDNFIIKYYSDNMANGMSMELDIIKLLVENGVDPFSHDNALWKIACYFMDYNLATYLISIGVKCNELDHVSMHGVFHRYGNMQIKKLFLENGVNPNVIMPITLCPLEFAILYEDLDSCKLLLEYGADINLCHNIVNENYQIIGSIMSNYLIINSELLDDICDLFPVEFTQKIQNVIAMKRNSYKVIREDSYMIESDENIDHCNIIRRR